MFTNSQIILRVRFALVLFSTLCGGVSAQQPESPGAAKALPRTANGKPNLQGIWEVRNRAASNLEAHSEAVGSPADRGVVDGGTIPYQAWAVTKKLENFAKLDNADPLGKCFLPGVPRIMYMHFPFQIFQTSDHVAILFEWSQVYRLIYTNGKPPLHDGIESWMGDSRGHWEGDTLVVSVKGLNDKTWFDLAGNFHSDAVSMTERYQLLDADTLQYEVTVEDPKVFTRPWKISMPIYRAKNMDRIYEYQCQDLAEEANGDFERIPRTWYPESGLEPAAQPAKVEKADGGTLAARKIDAKIQRGADGKPDLRGYFDPDHGDANYAIEKHPRTGQFNQPATKGVVIDPPDGYLPYQPWARAEATNRQQPYRGYDDPSAHCFPYGVPRSIFYPFQILQPPGYVVMLFERMSWRVIPLDGREHISDRIRLWQGDSIGHWEGDTLVVETTNLNGRSWLNETDVVSHAERTVERFRPIDKGQILYQITVTDPIVYTRPWTIEFPLVPKPEELLEVACHEDNDDLQHLKDVKAEHRGQQKTGDSK